MQPPAGRADAARPRGVRHRRALAAVAGAAVLALALTACGPQVQSRVEEGTRVDVAWSGELTSANAESAVGRTAANLDVAALTRSRFATVDDSGELVEDHSFGTATVVADDPFTVRYDLADTARWSDGVPVDAADLMLAWAATSNALSTDDLDLDALRGADGGLDLPDDAVWFDVARPGGMAHAESAERDDWARSIDVTFSQAVPDWRQALEVAVPAHVLGQRVLGVDDAMQAKHAVLDVIDRADPLALRELAEGWIAAMRIDAAALEQASLVSSGPYRVDAVQDGRVELVANGDYAGARGAEVERVVLQPVADDATALARLAAGELDVATVRPTADDRTVIRDLERDDATLLEAADGTRWELALRADRAPLQAAAARASLLRSLERGALAETVLAESPLRTTGTDSVLFRADTRIYGYALEDAGFPQAFGDPDAEAAAAAREALGIDAGTEVCVRYDRAEAFAAATLEVLRAQAAEAGWSLRDCGVDDLEAGLAEDDWHAVLQRVAVPASVEQIDERWRGGGITAASSAERDALLDEALATGDQDALESTLLELEASLVADALVLPLVEPRPLTIAAPGVTGIAPRPGDASVTWNAWEWGAERASAAP
ncbi:peptide/nickel transport system substrate-binding protein [Agrococcus carbonis]|uniref:Peptide/nickel transport system substrate-binding protein n=1 Tax=Agrococcus carbonis TaxID=684552 RepID=A0A1H1LK80_9MICO|nr:peptide/nickel transport system substrate-binding protein [Agrococcus carbonis]